MQSAQNLSSMARTPFSKIAKEYDALLEIILAKPKIVLLNQVMTMAYLKDFAFDSPRLLSFCLGGQTAKGNIEVHDVVFIVAKTAEEATIKIRTMWFGTKSSLHVDSWMALENIDGYDIEIGKTQSRNHSLHLYFVNLGYYTKHEMGKGHFMTFVVAESKRKAALSAMNQCGVNAGMLHIDDLHDLEGCIQIDKVDHYFIHLTQKKQNKQMQVINGYQKLRY